MENTIAAADFEKALVAQLSNASLDKKQLSAISKSIIELNKNTKIQYFDWRVKGTPGFYKIIIRGIVNPDIFQYKFLKNVPYERFQGFPVGIPPLEQALDIRLQFDVNNVRGL
jgi:hypothetical protein